MTQFLSAEEILRLHFQVVNDFGGKHGIRDVRRIESVVLAPQQTVFDQEQYPELCDKTAVYIRNIIGDHPFEDGNKRTGVTVAGVFLLRNGSKLTAAPKELEDFAVQVAVERLDVPAIAGWLRRNSQA